MRLRIISILILFILVSASFMAPAVVSGTNSFDIHKNIAAATNELPGDGGLFRTCQVVTRGGNLNVRDNYDRVVGKLPNGTWVRVITNDDDGVKFLIVARMRGRSVRGWVAAEFLDNCY